ncbi:MAG: PKD domain-containing protein, partial [Phaeodactylibacter sp.]|nr:PKD domain-containing protein [Phaeodactylibacter sp.]
MKRFRSIVLSVLFTLGWAFSGQAYEVTINGTVTAFDAPAPFIDLFIWSTDGSIIELAFTDANGQYSSTFDIPGGAATDISVNVIEFCTGAMLTEVISVSGPVTETVDFELCSDCQAGFYYYQPDPAQPIVQFQDQSADSPDSWTWEFGDGTTSTDQNPLHTYANEGDYTVSLTTTSGDTCSSTVAQFVWVYIDTFQTADCQANFFFDYSNPDNPLELSFIDFSWPIGEIVSWAWDFGDGTSSTEQHPVHVYAAAGLYEVSLTITAMDGCTSTMLFLIEAGFDP